MKEEISVREFRPEDAPEIVRLHKESEDCFEEMDVDEPFIYHVAARSDYKFYVAESSGRIVGFCGVLYFASFGRAEVGPIAVDKSFRRRLAASRLLERVLRFLRTNGTRRVIARVKAGNSGSLLFFSTAGFIQEGLFKEYTKKKEDVLQLVRFL